MHNLFIKYFIIYILFIATTLPLFFFDLIIIWFFLEISNFLFISLISFQINNKKIVFFYFIIQILTSFIIIIAIIFNNLIFYSNFFNILITLSLIIKLNLPPFHFWLPLISKFIPWNLLFLALSLQKIIPFYMLSLISFPIKILYLIIFLSIIIPPYIILNTYNFKILITYSSINQSRWLTLLIYYKTIIWIKYFIFYIISLFILLTIINYFKLNINFYYQTYSNNSFKFFILIFIFNIRGLPPFSFFYIKWYRTFLFLLNSSSLFIIICLMLRSLIIIFIYTNIIINFMFIYTFKSKLILFKISYFPFLLYLILRLSLSNLIFIILDFKLN